MTYFSFLSHCILITLIQHAETVNFPTFDFDFLLSTKPLNFRSNFPSFWQLIFSSSSFLTIKQWSHFDKTSINDHTTAIACTCNFTAKDHNHTCLFTQFSFFFLSSFFSLFVSLYLSTMVLSVSVSVNIVSAL